ncbi:general transcription factor II-I repeat domain-containing protein 1-like [Pomacea canaliculata]|uniref:general transcription factor II-I repeat domain-containing protein 1-like n=1 Tax=Pomacea canaliculata TaxID=400727 RepID=UPI000D727632|nr:general transcription factor II-I repeat domain-containing protein 1-like [Pomacea canaliculata]
MSDKSTQQFRRIIGQKRTTALSYFTKRGKHAPGETRSIFLARMREEWSRLGDEEKKAFKKDAVVYKQQPPQNEAEKIAYLRRVFSELNKLTDFMKQLGWSFYYKITTETDIMESPEGPAAALNPAPIPPTPIPPTPIAPSPTPRRPKGEKEEERANLRREVQNLFNELYGQATGNRGNFPYKRHHIMPEVAVTGLPDGVPFKEPFSYGLPALKAILAQKSQIKMHMVQASPLENPAPVTPGENTTAAVREVSLCQQLTGSDASLSPQANGDVPVVKAEEAFVKQEHSIDEKVPLKQEYSIAEELPLKKEHSIAEGMLLKLEQANAERVLLKQEHSSAEEVLKWEHSIAEEVPLNTGTCYKRERGAENIMDLAQPEQKSKRRDQD